ncbi:MAG: hypothetical protein QOJ59_48 [Thermomicrobiales bacterium]|jgi:Uma2 family endonuclease|nr:hypothetical protein [Thermomicrobiales bacterium]
MVLTASLDRPLTYDDLVTLPDDGTRCEPIGGEIYALPSPNLFHQLASGIPFGLFRDFVLVRQLGLVFAAPHDVRFDPRNIVQPHIVFLSREKRRLMRKGNVKLIDGAPDLLIEIFSPSNRGHDFIKKASQYATFGVREYWIIDAEAETTDVQVPRDRVFVPLIAEDGIVRSEVLPGFQVNPKGLFAIPDLDVRRSR